MEKLFEALKIFLEKHLMPTVLSLVLATFVYLISPAENWIINKITDKGYFLFCTGIIFLVIQLITNGYKYIKNKISYKAELEEYNKNKLNKIMEELWNFVDNLNENDRLLLLEFIHNDNSVIEKPGGWYAPGSILSNNMLVHCRMIYRDNKPINQYMLNEVFYYRLKYSYDNYKKISHFQDQNVS